MNNKTKENIKETDQARMMKTANNKYTEGEEEEGKEKGAAKDKEKNRKRKKDKY